MALQVDNLSFHYQAGEPVLRGICARFAAGTVTAIIGPNGAGKSTLLRLLACVLPPLPDTSGTIMLNGSPIRDLSAARRAALVGYLPQRSLLSEPLTVSQVVRLGRFARPRDEKAVEAAIELVGLRERAGDLFGELSAGQQQRAGLARVIAQLAGESGKPSEQIILADEPVSAQDPRHVADMMQLLREQARTVIVVLHDFTLAARYADEVVVLAQDGSVAASGSAEDTLVPGILERVFRIPFDRARLVEGDPGSIAVIARLHASRQ